MGIHDSQIRQSIRLDEENLQDAFMSMASVVMGEKITKALSNSRVQTKNAIDEILRYYNVKSMELPDSIEDVQDQLEYLLRPSGIMRRTINLDEGWYKDAFGPMLGSYSDGSGVVALMPTGFSGYSFFDKELGKLVKVTKKNAHLIDYEAISFYRPFPLKKLGVIDLVKMIIASIDISDYILVGIVMAAVTAVGLLIPAINNIIYRYVLFDTRTTLLVAVFAFLILVNLSQALFGAVQTFVLNRLGVKMSYAVESAAMMRVLSLPAKFFRSMSSGELSQRMGNISEICNMIVESVLTTGLTSIFSLVYIVQMLNYAPSLVKPGMIVIICTVVFSALSIWSQMRISQKMLELSAKEYGFEYALITGIQKVRLAGAENRVFAKWANGFSKLAKLQYDPPVIVKLSNVVSTGLALIGTVVIYFFTIKTNVSLADYFTFNTAFGMVLGAFSALLGVITNIALIKPMLELCKPILEAVPEISQDKNVITRLSGNIELDHVSFKYSDNGPLIVDDMSLKVKRGQYVAIVGKTGCGKSTLMRLLLGFEQPQKGSIYYDAKDLATIDLKSLRRNIGTVMQNGKLFQGDIFSNIVITAPWLTMDDAWEAARKAGIAEDIERMPMGMHTLIAEGAGGISGGQRQRIMIARAIAANPKVIMFDEATSALDNITQKIVSDSLAELKCTRIVIAHRLSTIKECDRIIVLDKGKIIEDGTYDELIAKEGFFAELVERQRLDIG